MTTEAKALNCDKTRASRHKLAQVHQFKVPWHVAEKRAKDDVNNGEMFDDRSPSAWHCYDRNCKSPGQTTGVQKRVNYGKSKDPRLLKKTLFTQDRTFFSKHERTWTLRCADMVCYCPICLIDEHGRCEIRNKGGPCRTQNRIHPFKLNPRQ